MTTKWIVPLGIALATSVSAENMLEKEWLFQCNNQPTLASVTNEIRYTQEMMARTPKVDFAAEQKVLDVLVKTPLQEADAEKMYLAVRAIKREVMFKNPAVNFNRVLLIDNPYPKGKQGDGVHWAHESLQRNGFIRDLGGSLITVPVRSLDAQNSNGVSVQDLLPQLKGSFTRPDLSWDGKRIVFSYCPTNDLSYHLYACNADGTDLQQLTTGDYDDHDPVFSPDGKIIFITSRQHSYVRCFPASHSFAVARCDADGKNIYVLSANGEPEYLPAVLNDGRIIFTRWEYTDKALWRVQSLWTMDQDGCNVQTFWGSQSVWPDVLTEARPIPGSTKIMFTGVGHHAWYDGTIGMIDPVKGLNYPDGLCRITRDQPWPEVGNGPADPAPHVEYHAAGKLGAYKTPWPLSEELFLVSAREGGLIGMSGSRANQFRLYLMDVYGNRELIYRGQYNALYAMPFQARKRPTAMTDKVKWPKITNNGQGDTFGKDNSQEIAPAIFYSNDVFENAPPILKEKGKFIRVIQMDPKTYTTWRKTVQHDGPAVSVFQADGVKRILGTVPIESDGSVNFEIPPGESIFFQMLDAEGCAIYVMRSFANGMPGERRGCFGCHETSMKTRSIQSPEKYKMGKALQKPAVKLTPTSWGAGESVGYTRFVQPVLEKHCASCHNKAGSEANKKLDMTYRPSTHGWGVNVYHRPYDVSPFAEPYYALVGGACGWAHPREKDARGVPENLAGIFIVEGYNSHDPANLATLPPYTAFSAVSTLISNACSGAHHQVKVTGLERERLIAWVDCNGPFLGEEEIRQMYDPQHPEIDANPKVRPRIATAPRINRFNLRQDGDTLALCGPLKLVDISKVPDRAQLIRDYRMEMIKKENCKVEILSAIYATKEKTPQVVDVTEKIRPTFQGTRFSPIRNYNEAFEPIAPIIKQLTIEYTINGGPKKTVTFAENREILLPL